MFKYLFSLPIVGQDSRERILKYTEQFWSIIEDYFFGVIPSKVESEVNNKLYKIDYIFN